MMPISARFIGTGRIRRTLARIPDEFRSEISVAVEKTARTIVEEAQSRVPVDTGALRDAISYRVGRNGLSATVGIRGKRAKRDVYYGAYIEFGTTKQPARPFLTPAFAHAKPEGVSDIKAAVRSALIKSTRAAGGTD